MGELNIHKLPLGNVPEPWSPDFGNNEVLAATPEGLQIVRDPDSGMLYVLRQGRLECAYEQVGFADGDGVALAEEVALHLLRTLDGPTAW